MLIAPAPAWAQEGEAGPGPRVVVLETARVPLHRREWVRPLASLIVPGSGQLLAGQDRGLVYLATEVWVVARAIALTRQGREERRRFQDLAFSVARSAFATDRREGGFEYYESMTHFVESGRYDVDPGVLFAPETDTLTFNGSAWLLARRTFFANPDSAPAPDHPAHVAAVKFYRARAVDDPFRWSWRDARLEQDVFRGAIRSSDDAFRAATNYFGILVLNHLGSAVDALVTIRVRGRTLPPTPRIELDSRPGAFRLVWSGSF